MYDFEEIQCMVNMEWWYDNVYQSSLKIPPFIVLYGYPPPLVTESEGRDARVAKIEEWLEKKQVMNRMLREQIMDSQNCMKYFADNKRIERQFQEEG